MYIDSCQVRGSFCDLTITQYIDKARVSVVVMGKNSFEPNTIMALMKARERNVNVGIVVNRHVFEMNAPDLQALKARGADIWIDQAHELYQLFAIDQRISIFDVDSAYNENLEIFNNTTYTMTHIMEWGAHASHSLKVSYN